MLSVTSLVTALTPDQVKASLYKLADTFGLNTTAWQKLSPTRTIFAIVAQLFSGFTAILATLAQAGFLDTAAGSWLDLLAFYVFGVTRIPATFAIGNVTIDNAGGGDYTFDPGDLQVLNSTTGKTYANTAQVTISPLATGVVVEVQALEQGSASTASPSQIDQFVSASPQLSVTNPSAIIGQDAELDADLKTRCRLSTAPLSPNGPAAAIEFVARTPSLVGGVIVTRVKVLPPTGDGSIHVYVANASGGISGTYSDPTTDLGKVFVGITTWAITSGYTLVLASASTHAVSRTATVWVPASASLLSADVSNAIALALSNYFSTIPIGGSVTSGSGKVSWRAMIGVIENSNSFIIEAQLDTESDVSLSNNEVATLTLGSTVVNQVSGI